MTQPDQLGPIESISLTFSGNGLSTSLKSKLVGMQRPTVPGTVAMGQRALARQFFILMPSASLILCQTCTARSDTITPLPLSHKCIKGNGYANELNVRGFSKQP